jgi:hypothetical protein
MEPGKSMLKDDCPRTRARDTEAWVSRSSPTAMAPIPAPSSAGNRRRWRLETRRSQAGMKATRSASQTPRPPRAACTIRLGQSKRVAWPSLRTATGTTVAIRSLARAM